MFDRQSIHIALLLWGCIFSLLAAVCMFMSKNFDREKRKCMLYMQLSCAVLLCSDAFAWAFRGGSGTFAWFFVRCSNFLVFFFSDVILFLFHGYVCLYLFEKKNGNRAGNIPSVRIRAGYIIALAGMALVVISQFTHWYYFIDASNYYHRSSAYVIALVLPLCGMLLDLTLLIQYRKNISRDIFVSMVSYIALPFAASLVLLFYYGISLINIAICISLILMFIVSMVEQNRNLARKEKEAADLRISITLSQIAPHFIYNTLSAIQYLCGTDPELAKETVGEFAQYLRGNLDGLSEKERIPFERELKHVQCYLAIEKKRFEERVNVVYDIEKKDFLIPPLTMQPLVENAVKHGICKKEEGGTIWIRTRYERGNIVVQIKDDGIGFEVGQMPEDGAGHVGLHNVETRLKEMCDGKMEVDSIPGQGTSVTLYIPQDA